MKIGYIRISTAEQNTARQEVLMKELEVDNVFIDKMSGKNTNRPELQKMMNFVREGDTVIVESISRFARNTKDLLDLVERLTEKKVTQDVAIKRRIAKKINIYNDYNDMALHQMTEFGHITFLTYQQLKKMIKDKTISSKDISFAIFDEAHYFTSDATFSQDNGWLLSQIPKMYSNSIRIYITATVKDVLPYICSVECNAFANSRWKKRWIQDEHYYKISQGITDISKEELNELTLDEQYAFNAPVPILYMQENDYSHIKLKFYTDDSDIEEVLNGDNQKAIILWKPKKEEKNCRRNFPIRNIWIRKLKTAILNLSVSLQPKKNFIVSY